MAPAADDVVFPILGRPFRARGASAPLRAWLDEQWRRPEHAPPPHPFAIALECVEAGRAPAALEGVAVRATGPGVDLDWRHRDATWEWRGGDGAGVRLTLEPERARIRAWGTDAPGADLFAALYVAMCEALRASGLVSLHAAVAVPPDAAEGARATGRRAASPDPDTAPHAPDRRSTSLGAAALDAAADAASAASGAGTAESGRAPRAERPAPPERAVAAARLDGAIAFLGPSGTGKSTTLLRLARAGWTPLAEDLSWVEPHTLTLYGWDRGVRLWPGTLEAFLPELLGAGWTTGPDGKLFLGYDALARRNAGRAAARQCVDDAVTGSDVGASAPDVDRTDRRCGDPRGHGRGDSDGREGFGERTPGTAMPRCAMLAGIALLERAPAGESGWEPLSPRDAVRALWEAVGVPFAPASRGAAATWIAAAPERFALHRLRLGTEMVPGPPATPK
ncbi:MAG TPA: ATP-binding protein [Longimicrobiales bacterium]